MGQLSYCVTRPTFGLGLEAWKPGHCKGQGQSDVRKQKTTSVALTCRRMCFLEVPFRVSIVESIVVLRA
jgi:hypothetical protein